MAWLSPSWSAELTEQAIARIYRPGQTQHVTIHVCVAAGTVDEMKRDRVISKMSAQEAFRRHLERSNGAQLKGRHVQHISPARDLTPDATASNSLAEHAAEIRRLGKRVVADVDRDRRAADRVQAHRRAR